MSCFLHNGCHDNGDEVVKVKRDQIFTLVDNLVSGALCSSRRRTIFLVQCWLNNQTIYCFNHRQRIPDSLLLSTSSYISVTVFTCFNFLFLKEQKRMIHSVLKLYLYMPHRVLKTEKNVSGTTGVQNYGHGHGHDGFC